MSDDTYGDLVELLKERGHTDDEIAKILTHVQQYEEKMKVDSVMDSIAGGRFSLSEIIEDALGKE